ncbi:MULTISPECIES: FAD-dependent monooxygenase [unclassified Streptomyces]|uniref:FAD-dependent monooxygenase n=1 Tax=unclassified Streptomyces TaxID=2593676 RepID=UPI00386ADC15
MRTTVGIIGGGPAGLRPARLSHRTGIDCAVLESGPRAHVEQRRRVREPMNHGRLFLAGDAAHIVPPTGAKGLNLAVSDVRVPARGFAVPHRTGSVQLRLRYWELFLDRVWQATRFSYDMTRMLHAQPNGDVFDHRVQLAGLRRITASRHAAAEPAANHTGLPLGR